MKFGSKYSSQLIARGNDHQFRIETSAFSDLQGRMNGSYYLDEDEVRELRDELEDWLGERNNE